MAPCQAGVVFPTVDRDAGLERLVEVVLGCCFRLFCLSDDLFGGCRGDAEVLDMVEGDLPFTCGHARDFSVEGLEAEGNECR